MNEAAGKLEGIRVELARHEEERARLGTELQVRLDEARTAREKVEAAWAEEAERTRRTEEEFIRLQRKREELHAKFTTEQPREAARHAPLEPVQTEPPGRAADEARLEAESRSPLAVTTAATETADAIPAETAERDSQIERQKLAVLQPEGDELHGKFTREQQTGAKLTQRGDELENRLRETTAELESLKATQTRQAAEHKRLEAEWQERLNASQSAAAHAEATAKEEAARCRWLERDLENLRNERNQIHDKFREAHQAGVKYLRRITELENRLQESTTELKHAKAELKNHVRAETD